MKRIFFLMAALVLGLSVSANATLIDRGGGLIYDDDRNITWLADANYAKTSGYDPDGYMTWSQAVTWANNLVYHDSVRNVDYTDWRLPSAFEQDGSGPYAGWPATSEMGHLFYNELGGWLGQAIDYMHNANYGLFVNIYSVQYWAGQEYALDANAAWNFYFDSGYQNAFSKNVILHAMAVRDGDVATAPVPEPGTWMLLGSGLAGLVVFRRRFARQ